MITEAVKTHLQQYQHCQQLYIAYSGGVDSHVLLHCCAQLPDIKAKITAVYIHHGLQKEADAWVQHCAQQCAELAVNFMHLSVDAKAASGESPEEAAREARYHALKSLVKSGEILLTGQHREDQLETVLLQLFRGAGLAGLAGMPVQADFGKGFLVRPLLDMPGDEIRAYAQQQQLNWVEDPSNQQCDFERNYLRNKVIPLLKKRWPGLDQTVSRAGKHCAEAQDYLAQHSRELLQSVYKPSDNTLLIDRLLSKNDFSQRQIIRAWFSELGFKMPSVKMVEQIQHAVMAARPDAEPKLFGQGFELRRYRNQLYCLPIQQPLDTTQQLLWAAASTSLPLPGNGQLLLVNRAGPGLHKQCLQEQLCVRYRQGGERIRLPGRQGRHSLKKLFQEIALPPWVRKKIPLIYINEQLVAVADVWIDAQFYSTSELDNVQIIWQQETIATKAHD